MKIAVAFDTAYEYAEPVSFGVHLFRLFPRAGRDLRVVSAEFESNDDARVSYRRDLFDNEIASVFYPEKASSLIAKLHLELEVEPRNPFSFIVSPDAVDFPFHYDEDHAQVLTPYLAHGTPLTLPFWRPPEKPAPTVSTLVDLNAAFREHLEYERREEGQARSPEETLKHLSGACRDFAVLLAATLRGLGIAARLASGYLLETSATDRRAEGALHAWTEAYLPGAGWIGFDPTNGVLCNHCHITAAVGITANHVTPTFGRFYHSQKGIESRMRSNLHIHERT